jgi:hypothetical protein
VCRLGPQGEEGTSPEGGAYGQPRPHAHGHTLGHATHAHAGSHTQPHPPLSPFASAVGGGATVGEVRLEVRQGLPPPGLHRYAAAAESHDSADMAAVRLAAV